MGTSAAFVAAYLVSIGVVLFRNRRARLAAERAAMLEEQRSRTRQRSLAGMPRSRTFSAGTSTAVVAAVSAADARKRTVSRGRDGGKQPLLGAGDADSAGDRYRSGGGGSNRSSPSGEPQGSPSSDKGPTRPPRRTVPAPALRSNAHVSTPTGRV